MQVSGRDIQADFLSENPMNPFLKNAVPGVQALHPYQPGKPVEALERELGICNAIKLASNENPLGPSTYAMKAAQAVIADINYYPDGAGHNLSAALAEKHQVDLSCITLGNGSNDILELIGRAFLAPGNSAVYSEYSFAVYPLVVQATGAQARVSRAYPADHLQMPYGHDLSAVLDLIDHSTRVVFIANPNNPTGTWFVPDELSAFLAKVDSDVVVVLDEAYYEYMPEELKPDSKTLLKKYKNLVITRTFSKIYGLAGLRIGYSVSHPNIADILNRVRQPFNTSMPAQAAALAAIDDQAHVANSVKLNTLGLKQYMAAFESQGLEYIPSIANFIAVDLKCEAMPVYDQLLREGVIVRPVASYNMPEHLRITIGAQSQNERVLNVLAKILKSAATDD
ncbi:Biosynthetic Aromatic amino acid aminotransferase beta [hydrothermal vent metagenome]|uniref:Biosynthetic Aromatic amino acid aminotransferase beta n=1 Tax=hydrothermal vent metagenome TaxID=652676 RepID=A0A3B0XF81_9ZZZZ